MNSPYMGKFRVTQQYKGSTHDGLDLVGIDSKNIHSTVNGVVEYAGWENYNNKSQGFGQYVKIKQDGTNDHYYFGHLSKINVKVGQHVKITDIIGVEGSTGYSTGSHCHYCCRVGGVRGNHKDINKISGIPNAIGTYDDGYRPNQSNTQPNNQKWLNLPKEDERWRVYRLNVKPVVGNECGFICPKMFGGLSYIILDNPMTDIYTIKTDTYGKVNIYGAASTGATITTTRKYKSGN